MFALIGRRFVQSASASVGDGGARRLPIVLPRPLRRAARLMAAPDLLEERLPRRIGLISAFAFLGLTGLYGMALGGHTGHVLNSGATFAGFAVADVVVSGNRETSEIDILQALGLDGATSILALSAPDARAALMELPWVAEAQVRKLYPNQLEIQLEEREAFAIWQSGQSLVLIERNGGVIAPMREKRFSGLPLFVGLGAEAKAAGFDRMMAAHPELKQRVRAYVRVADRRWDLYLTNGVIVRLPEEGPAEALAELAELERSRGLLSRDIAAVDLRLNDRITVRLTSDSHERRQVAIEKRTRDMRAKGWRI